MKESIAVKVNTLIYNVIDWNIFKFLYKYINVYIQGKSYTYLRPFIHFSQIKSVHTYPHNNMTIVHSFNSFHLCLLLPVICLPHVSTPVTELSIPFPNLHIRPAHHIPLDLVSRIKYWYQYRSRSFSLCKSSSHLLSRNTPINSTL